MPGSVTDMSESADLGVIEAKTDPTVAYHKVHAARMSAQRAFVHLDTSNRVASALTCNAAPQRKEYAVGDLVCYRRDAQQGGTTWSTASRVIGHDPHTGLWLLHGGVPILCSTSRVRSANESEALAFSILNGEPVLLDAIVSGPQLGIWGSRGSGIWGNRGSGIWGNQGSGIWGNRGLGILTHTSTSNMPISEATPSYRGSGIWGNRGSGIWGNRGSGIWGNRGSGIWGNRGSGIWGNRGSGIWGTRGSGIGGNRGSPRIWDLG